MAAILLQNKYLKSINLQRVSLDDSTAFYLIEGFVRAASLSTIKLDFNKLTGVFVERFCKKISMSGFTQQYQQLSNNASGSVLASESEETISRLNSDRITSQGVPTGLLNLSFEGNNLGDRGAEAIALLIQTKND